MTIFLLTRKRVMSNRMQGVLSLNDSSFSCHTLEAKDPRGQNPFNPTFQYALPEGEYPLKIGANGAYIIVPFILYKPYKQICICDFPGGAFKPGCIAVGSDFISDKLLDGGMPVMDALHDILTMRVHDFRNGDAILKIEYADDCIVDSEAPYEDDFANDMDSDYNFANL